MRTAGAAAALCSLCSTLAFVPRASHLAAPRHAIAATLRRAATTADDNDWDAVVVGSGIGGLSCAAILATAGKRVLVCEAHDRAGGVAHDYEVQGFTFEAASATRRSDRVDGVEVPRSRPRHDPVPAGSRTALPSTRASRPEPRRTR